MNSRTRLPEQELPLNQNSGANPSKKIAFVYGAHAGFGGLGIQSANAAAGLALHAKDLHAFGPGHIDRWPIPQGNKNIHWHEPPRLDSSWSAKYIWQRWYPGRLQLEGDVRLGGWAAEKTSELKPQLCYAFTQVGLEVLKWAKQDGVPSVLESPNGHIRNFREVYEVESARWCGTKFHGHPSPEMVERVEKEYELADRIRVSSEWAKASMVARGVPARKIHVLQQPVDLERFHPSAKPRDDDGPLRICFVGSLDLRKGFVYLLRALRLIGPEKVSLEIVGATGTRCCARLFEKESRELRVTCAPGDPLPAYHRAELFVLPTLEDGSPFAVAEAMASGLPVIVTDSCGSAEWVTPEHTGWVVRAREPEALAEAFETALRRRADLKSMGDLARKDTERRAGPAVSQLSRIGSAKADLMSEVLMLQAIKKSSFGKVLKKIARPLLPGWVDAGRMIVQGSHLRQMLQRVMHESPEVKNILNAGSGEGLYSPLLLEFPNTQQVLEVDASYNQRFRRAKDVRQRVLVGSLTTLPLGDQTISLILCSEVLEHIEEDEQALSELTRVLSPGGWLLLSVPTPPAVFDPAHVREGYYLGDLSRLLENNGLDVVEVRFCMHAVFKFFLKSYRQGWVPRGVVFTLSWLDRCLPLGQPMDLMILARRGASSGSRP